MPKPEVVGQPTSQQHFSRGIDMVTDLLASTLGPTGGQVISERNGRNSVELLDDAPTAVRRIISLGRKDLDVGAMVMRNVVWNIGQRAGDGGATAAVLLRAIHREGIRLITGGVNAMQLTRGLAAATEVAIEALRAQTQPVATENELANVARTITDEEELSAVLGEMSFLLGPDAHIITEKFVAPYLRRRYIAGAHYPAQIASMYFYTDATQQKAILSAPALAVVDDKLTAADQVVPLLEAAIKLKRKGLVIIAKEITGEALSVLVTNNQAPKDKKKLDILGVRLTNVGDELRWARADLATMTGGNILGLEGARGPRRAQPEDLGLTRRVEFGNKALVVVPESGTRHAVQEEVLRLRAYVADLALDDEDRPKYVKRLAALSGGVGELKIGANTKVERELLQTRADRAFKVLSAALRGGVVAGGGAALHHCTPALLAMADDPNRPEEQRIAAGLLAKALSAPMRQILSNSGVDAEAVYLNRVAEAGARATYDAHTGQVVDAFDAGILDVTDVVAHVLRTAVSGATMVLSTDTIVYHRKPQQSLTP